MHEEITANADRFNFPSVAAFGPRSFILIRRQGMPVKCFVCDALIDKGALYYLEHTPNSDRKPMCTTHTRRGIQ